MILAVAAALLAGGCSSVQVGGSLAPGVAPQLTGETQYYVVKLPADERGIDEVIVADLEKRGLAASSGEAGSAPAEVNVLVTYEDRWMWDMTMYMLRINIRIEDAQTGELLGSGESYRTSLARKAPEAMVAEVFDAIFASK